VENDKTFAAYALILALGVASMLIFGVTVLGDGTWPSPLSMAEHVALGLLMRAGYKQIGGSSWADWSLAGDSAEEAAELLPAGSTADAIG
jgi:hypothetical protein